MRIVGALAGALALAACGRFLAADGDEGSQAKNDAAADVDARSSDASSGGSTIDADADEQDAGPDGAPQPDANLADVCVVSEGCAASVAECCSQQNGFDICGGVCTGNEDICCL